METFASDDLIIRDENDSPPVFKKFLTSDRAIDYVDLTIGESSDIGSRLVLPQTTDRCLQQQ